MTSPTPLPAGPATLKHVLESIRELHSCLETVGEGVRLGQEADERQAKRIEEVAAEVRAVRHDGRNRALVHDAQMLTISKSMEATKADVDTMKTAVSTTQADLAGVKGYTQAISQSLGVKQEDALDDNKTVSRRAGGMSPVQLLLSISGSIVGAITLLQVSEPVAVAAWNAFWTTVLAHH
jgi:hypothetical protein